MFRFPWSNFHELNLDWILEVVKEAKEIFVNGRSDIDNAVETANEALEVAEQAAAAVIADGAITIPKLNNEVLKTTAYVIVGNRADEAVPAGAYVYLRKSAVAGLADGIYTAAVNIPAGAIVTPAEFQQSTELHNAGALNVLKAEDTAIRNSLNTLANNVAYPNLNGTNNTGSTIQPGTFFYNNGTLVKSTTSIEAGSDIVIGTNATQIADGGLNAISELKYTNLGSLTLSSLETQLYSIGTNGQNVVAVSSNISQASGLFVPSQYNGFVFRLTSSRCYALIFRGDILEVIIGRCQSGTWTWKEASLI